MILQRSTLHLLGKQRPSRLDSWRGQFALTATLSFHSVLSANLWFEAAVEAWRDYIDLKGVIREQLPTYGSKSCHFMAQVSDFLPVPQPWPGMDRMGCPHS